MNRGILSSIFHENISFQFSPFFKFSFLDHFLAIYFIISFFSAIIFDLTCILFFIEVFLAIVWYKLDCGWKLLEDISVGISVEMVEKFMSWLLTSSLYVDKIQLHNPRQVLVSKM